MPLMLRFALAYMLTACALMGSAQAAERELPYVYGAHPSISDGGSPAVEIETAAGTRNTRPFGSRGFETGARLRFGAFKRFDVAAQGFALFDGGGFRAASGGIEATGWALRQDGQYIDLGITGGYTYDYQRVNVPYARLTINRDFGGLNLNVWGRFEFPLAKRRDAVDLILGTAVSYAVLPGFRVGGEVAVEDVEGFFEDEEAEGGAKVVFGPTLWWRIPATGLYLRGNVSPVYELTRTTPASGGTAPAPSVGRWSVLGRVSVGWWF